MNEITERQLRPAMLDLLRARRLIYRGAKRYQAGALILTFSLPVAAAIASAWYPVARPFIATIAVLFGVFEVTTIDRWLKARLKCAAKLQEEFDCDVLDIHWNEFLAGSKVDAEVTYEIGHAPLDAADERRLRDWYPTAVAEVPIEVARLICQRENLVYDSDLRLALSRIILWVLVGFVVLGCLAAVMLEASFPSIVLGLFVPTAPALTWALRENKRQADTLETLTRLKSESENLLRATLKGCDPGEARVRSRELQDAIFTHRVTSPLVFEWLYNRLRPRLEAKLVHGAERWVEESKKWT